jgi:hypothetical protein
MFDILACDLIDYQPKTGMRRHSLKFKPGLNLRVCKMCEVSLDPEKYSKLFTKFWEDGLYALECILARI